MPIDATRGFRSLRCLPGWGRPITVVAALLACAVGASAQPLPTAAQPAAPGEPSSQQGASPAAASEDLWHRDTLTGNWGGWRDRLAKKGVTVSLNYTGEVLSNVQGGIRTGTIYEGLLQGRVDADLEKLLGWAGASYHVSAFNYAGHGLSVGNVGGIMTVSGNEAPAPSTKIWEMYLEQMALHDRLGIRVGLLSLESQEFLITDASEVFVGSTFGSPDPIAADLPGGGPFYPLSSPGVRLKLQASQVFDVMAAVLSGDPTGGNGSTVPPEAYPTGTIFSFSGGTIAIVQARLRLNQEKNAVGRPVTFRLGAWSHSGSRFADQRFADNGVSLASPLSSGVPLMHGGNWGLFGSVDGMIYRVPGTKNQGLSAFVLGGAMPPNRNLADRFFNAGLTYTGALPRCADDVAGIAFAYVHVSRNAQALDRDQQAFDPGLPVRDQEMMLELTYQAKLTDWWTLQPDAQRWFHPGGRVLNPDGRVRRDVLVVGLRSQVTF